MWALLDHLNASILLSAVVLLFLATQMGGQEAQIASTIRASGTGLYEAADWIERDLANLGDGVAEADPAIVDFAWDGDTPRFTFRTGNDTTLAAAATLVLYDLAPGATPEHRELRRFVVDGADTTLTARTPATLRLATAAPGRSRSPSRWTRPWAPPTARWTGRGASSLSASLRTTDRRFTLRPSLPWANTHSSSRPSCRRPAPSPSST